MKLRLSNTILLVSLLSQLARAGTLDSAYAALNLLQYDQAQALFRKALSEQPSPRIYKDLAYALLKTGDNEEARDCFESAMKLDPADEHVAMEYAFLAFETGRKAEARLVFERLAPKNATAKQAFDNIDKALEEGITRWLAAVTTNPNNFSAHEELARLAEERNNLPLAAEHYMAAWKLKPQYRALLLKYGRIAGDAGFIPLLAASRGSEPRTAQAARELLPKRYPFVYEFEQALQLDPSNIELHRELAYLHLAMSNKSEAEKHFIVLAKEAPDDLLSAAQLGFLLLERNQRDQALPFLERVLKGNDDDLADRVRKALGLPQALRQRPEIPRSNLSDEAKTLAQISMDKGYMKDALKYLNIANEHDPIDFEVMLKLGWANNIMKDDDEAVRWFDLARRSPDPKIASEAAQAFSNLERSRPAPVKTTVWAYPFYSSRWKSGFAYAQAKTELNIKWLPFKPYLSTRFAGDTASRTTGAYPQLLSETALLFGVGIATPTRHGLTLWAEAGAAVSYMQRQQRGTLSDYRGGVSYARGIGHLLGAKRRGMFFEMENDGVFLSRFQNDFLVYSQNRIGYTLPPNEASGLQWQLFWTQNITADAKTQPWANYAEGGPGFRFRIRTLPVPLLFHVTATAGTYLRGAPEGRKSTFIDIRAGVWYAISH